MSFNIIIKNVLFNDVEVMLFSPINLGIKHCQICLLLVFFINLDNLRVASREFWLHSFVRNKNPQRIQRITGQHLMWRPSGRNWMCRWMNYRLETYILFPYVESKLTPGHHQRNSTPLDRVYCLLYPVSMKFNDTLVRSQLLGSFAGEASLVIL